MKTIISSLIEKSVGNTQFCFCDWFVIIFIGIVFK